MKACNFKYETSAHVFSCELFQTFKNTCRVTTARKVSRYRAFSGPYFSVFGQIYFSHSLHDAIKFTKFTESRTLRSETIFGNWNPFKNDEKCFLFYLKSFFFVLQIFRFFFWLFGHVAKRLDQKDKVNFKFYDVTAWLTTNCYTHIIQYLKR